MAKKTIEKHENIYLHIKKSTAKIVGTIIGGWSLTAWLLYSLIKALSYIPKDVVVGPIEGIGVVILSTMMFIGGFLGTIILACQIED